MAFVLAFPVLENNTGRFKFDKMGVLVLLLILQVNLEVTQLCHAMQQHFVHVLKAEL